MARRTFRVGQKIVVFKKDKTTEYFGWDPGMDKFIDKVSTIREIFDSGEGFRLEETSFYSWHTDDARLADLPGIPEVTLEGQKQNFDVNELT